MKNLINWFPFILTICLDIFVLGYFVLQMIENPVNLSVKITCTFFASLVLGFFTWFSYEITKDIINDEKRYK